MSIKWGRIFIMNGLLFVLLLTLAACSSGGGGGGGTARVTISGTISSGAAQVSAMQSTVPRAVTVNGVTIDKIVGFQVCGGSITAEETADVDPTGDFSLSIVKGGEGCGVVAMLLDSTEVRKIDQVKGFISIPTASGSEPLIGLPTSSAQSVINLGAISELGDAQQTTAALAETFGMTDSQLTEIAQVDSVLRNIKNTWANTSNGTYYYYSPGFAWSGSYLTVDGNGWTTLGDYFFKGTALFFRTNDPAFTQAAICPSNASDRKPLLFLPPADFAASLVSFGGPTVTETITTTTGFNNNYVAPSAATCINAGLPDANRISGTFSLVQNSGATDFNWGGGGVAGSFPENTWTMQLDGQDKAWFDVQIVNPLDAGGNPLVYVPSFKVEADGNGKITSVLVKFYLWNGSAYSQVTDPAGLSIYAKYLSPALTHIGQEQAGGNEMLQLQHVGSGEFRATPTKTFYTTGNCPNPLPTSSWCAHSLSLGYSLFGLGVRFDLR